MSVLWGTILLGGFFPLYGAWRAAAGTTLRPAIIWAGCAWGAWVAAAWSEGPLLTYLALCLSGCAGVAVLGARRPGVGAWNFVVAGLLAVLLRPLAEGLGELRLSTAHLLFLGGALAVPVLNYLPTRFWLAALLLAGAWGVELARLEGAEPEGLIHWVGRALLAAAPWAALGQNAFRRQLGEVDALWLAHRDSFGALWGLRVREQFNRAARNGGLGGELNWGGLRGSAGEEEKALGMMRAVLKRFGPGDEPPV